MNKIVEIYFTGLEEIFSHELSNLVNNLTNDDECHSIFFTKYSIDANDISKKSDIVPGNGVYIFLLNKKLEYSKSDIDKFNSVSYGSKMREDHEGDILNLCKNSAFYLGKSFEINKRIDQHCNLNTGTTYSLRLSNESRNSFKGILVVKYFVLKDEYEPFKDIILSSIEQKLHTLFTPYVGSKRI